MRPFRPRLTYANVVSTLCLFIVLGGGAWAAKTQLLPKNSVGTPQLKAGAVTGAKVKNGSLSGADINAATLGKVPQAVSAESATDASHATSADSAGHANTAGSADHATSADTATKAGDATTLDGNGPDAFYPAGGIRRIDAAPPYNGGAVTIYSANGLVLTAACAEGGVPSLTGLSISAASTAPAARADVGLVEHIGATEKPFVGEYGIGSTPAPIWTTVASNHGDYGQSVGTIVYTDDERSIDISLATQVNTNQECQLTGTAAANG